MLTNSKLATTIYLAALAAFAPFSTDVYLASMPTIQRLFHTSASNVQLTLSLFLIGFAISQLVWGPLSDRIGRKSILFLGLLIYILSSLFCAWSESILQLILLRIFQAIGASSGMVAVFAIVKDMFPDKQEMSKILSGIVAVMMIAPIIAPVVGSYLLVAINWRANFYFLAGYSWILLAVTFLFKESYPSDCRKPLPISRVMHAYAQQIRNVPFLLAALALATNFSVLFAFISSSSFIYLDIYHVQPHLFGYLFAINAFSLIVGSVCLRVLKKVFSDKRIIMMAVSVSLVGSIIMLISIYSVPNSFWSVVIPSFVVTLGVGVLYPELTAQALHNVVEFSGLASSLAGTIRFIFAALTGLLMGFVIAKSALPLAVVMIVMNILTAGFMLVYFTML